MRWTGLILTMLMAATVASAEPQTTVDPAAAGQAINQDAEALAKALPADDWSGWHQVALNPARLRLRSSTVLIVDQKTGEQVFGKNTDNTISIASITKLMSAMVTLDAKLPLDEPIQITKEDRDRLRGSRSRLRHGQVFTRGELLHLALVASENRAAAALGRTFPGGKPAFVEEMNKKAKALGLENTQFADPTGLRSENVSTARELVKMVQAAYEYPFIREATTQPWVSVRAANARRPMKFGNTNRLVRNDDWHIGLSKTGYISDSGYCLVMQTEIGKRPLIMVLLDSWGKQSRIGDAKRIKKWLEKAVHNSHSA